MKFENTEVFNFKGAFRGMRNPLESWNKSDSFIGLINVENEYPEVDIAINWANNENKIREQKGRKPHYEDTEEYEELVRIYENWLLNQGGLAVNKDQSVYDIALIGPKDLELAQRLVRAGNEHAKFMRQIFVCVDITAPIYWWKEADTYKVGTVANSTSTMHKLASKPITSDMFEFDNDEIFAGMEDKGDIKDYIRTVISICNHYRERYIETNDKRYWRALVQILPQSWLQTRTVTMSYANLRNIYFQRKNHKLIEWLLFCDWIKTLPYAQELITLEDEK